MLFVVSQGSTYHTKGLSEPPPLQLVLCRLIVMDARLHRLHNNWNFQVLFSNKLNAMTSAYQQANAQQVTTLPCRQHITYHQWSEASSNSFRKQVSKSTVPASTRRSNHSTNCSNCCQLPCNGGFASWTYWLASHPRCWNARHSGPCSERKLSTCFWNWFNACLGSSYSKRRRHTLAKETKLTVSTESHHYYHHWHHYHSPFWTGFIWTCYKYTCMWALPYQMQIFTKCSHKTQFWEVNILGRAFTDYFREVKVILVLKPLQFFRQSLPKTLLQATKFNLCDQLATFDS